jgi:hypothetical protein
LTLVSIITEEAIIRLEAVSIGFRSMADAPNFIKLHEENVIADLFEAVPLMVAEEA